MKKKIFALLLVPVMLLSMLGMSAPGGGQEDETTQTETGIVETQETATNTTETVTVETVTNNDEGGAPTTPANVTDPEGGDDDPAGMDDENESGSQEGGETGGETTPTQPDVFFTVRFECNGGSEVEAQQVKQGEAARQPDDPTREGFDFEGWYQDGTLSVRFDFAAPITADAAAYASWTEIEAQPPRRGATARPEQRSNGPERRPRYGQRPDGPHHYDGDPDHTQHGCFYSDAPGSGQYLHKQPDSYRCIGCQLSRGCSEMGNRRWQFSWNCNVRGGTEVLHTSGNCS